MDLQSFSPNPTCPRKPEAMALQAGHRTYQKEAFGPDRVAVVTAPSAAYLYCMRRLQRRGALNSTAQVNASDGSGW